MPILLRTKDKSFSANFEQFLECKRDQDKDVQASVLEIFEDVRANGDQAIIKLTEKYDNVKLTPETFEITEEEIDQAILNVPSSEMEALELAAKRITSYHERQKPDDVSWVDDIGAELGWRWRAVDRAGIYVPGGQASYPSSVLMNAIPARVAGVDELIMCVPTPNGEINPLVLAAARLCNVDKVYRIGGAQAIAAMAFGTETIQTVDQITGPGNIYVATAKQNVYGQVGIDMIAGPSEVLVIADDSANPEWVAMDLVSQAEHDASAQAIVITNSENFASAISKQMDKILDVLPRTDIATKSWQDFGAIIIVETLAEAVTLSNKIAPEHLELCLDDPDMILDDIKHAGAIFIGHWTPEAIGDYIGGPNHVLPTNRTARFSSGLSVLDFMKRTTLSRMTPNALKEIGPAAVRLAQSESLDGHARSISLRMEAINDR